MCAGCEPSGPEWKSEPGTPERIQEIKEHQKETVLDRGHQVVYVFGEPEQAGFAYTVGRTLFERCELLMTGSLAPEMATGILNSLADLDTEGKINLMLLARDMKPVRIEGFTSELRFMVANPVTAQMNAAMGFAGGHIQAVQVIWPDAHGNWPGESGFEYGSEAQPLFPLVHF